MHSMTGFGSGKCSADGREVAVEIKTVNHRFLDINYKYSKSLSFLETALREEITRRLGRGHVEVFLVYSNTREDAKKIEVDEGLFAQYISALSGLGDKYGINKDVTYSDILRMQDVFKVTEKDDDKEAIIDITKNALNIALDGLIAMRKTEGLNMYNDVKQRIENVKAMFKTVVNEAPRVPEEYLQKMKQRISELLSGVDIDEGRLLTEAAVFADKCNIDEEIARFKSHIMQFEKAMESSEPVGRKLDFTLQEINREINTIGSKANDSIIGSTVMDIKAELEKIREQVQNIE